MTALPATSLQVVIHGSPGKSASACARAATGAAREAVIYAGDLE
jgi:hypothetical protein